MISPHFAGDEHDLWADWLEMKNEDIVRYDLDRTTKGNPVPDAPLDCIRVRVYAIGNRFPDLCCQEYGNIPKAGAGQCQSQPDRVFRHGLAGVAYFVW